MSVSKYRNVKTEIDGIVFSSKREGLRYLDLKMLLRSGIISDLVLQKKFPIQVNGVKVCVYVCDFSYLDQNGREVVEDVKGLKTPVYRIKNKLMIAVYGLRIVEVS
jgi:hypothetical protein